MPVYDCGESDCTQCKAAFRTSVLAPVDAVKAQRDAENERANKLAAFICEAGLSMAYMEWEGDEETPGKPYSIYDDPRIKHLISAPTPIVMELDEVRAQALVDAYNAVKMESLDDPESNLEDKAYELAIHHALRAIHALQKTVIR